MINLPTYAEVRANGAPPVAPGEHYWMLFHHLTCCFHCGAVSRRDGKYKPCRGKVRVGLRAPNPAAERIKSDSQALNSIEQPHQSKIPTQPQGEGEQSP